jgi:hypothetical protein
MGDNDAMPMGGASLREAILELGLEDLIPLPEAITAVEVVGATSGDPEVWRSLSEVLKDLVGEHRVQIFRGRWNDDNPATLPDNEALEVLGEERWYAFHTEDPDEERIYFVNVENIRTEEP